MLVITLLESVDGIVTSDGEDVEVSEGCKGAEDVSVRGVFPFPPNPRAIVTVVSIFACCLAEEKWNKALIEADENLISRLNIFDVSSICKYDDYDDDNDNLRCNEGCLEAREKVRLKI